MISLGLSRIDFDRLREPRIRVVAVQFTAREPTAVVYPLLIMEMHLVAQIPSNVRCLAPLEPRTFRRLARALDGVLQVTELPPEAVVTVNDLPSRAMRTSQN